MQNGTCGQTSYINLEVLAKSCVSDNIEITVILIGLDDIGTVAAKIEDVFCIPGRENTVGREALFSTIRRLAIAPIRAAER